MKMHRNIVTALFSVSMLFQGGLTATEKSEVLTAEETEVKEDSALATYIIFNNDDETKEEQLATYIIFNDDEDTKEEQLATYIIFNNDDDTKEDQLATYIIFNNDDDTKEDQLATYIIFNNDEKGDELYASKVVLYSDDETKGDQLAVYRNTEKGEEEALLANKIIIYQDEDRSGEYLATLTTEDGEKIHAREIVYGDDDTKEDQLYANRVIIFRKTEMIDEERPYFASNQPPPSFMLDTRNEGQVMKANNCANLLPVMLTGTYIPPNQRILQGKQIDGLTVELDDGSVWKVSPSYSEEVRNWWKATDQFGAGDNLSISPSSFPCLSGGSYYIMNERTGTYVYAELFLGPYHSNPNTNHIIDIDYNRGQVFLENGLGIRSCWEIDSSDWYDLNNWKINETVIIGVNGGWGAGFFSNCDSILINVERNSYIRVYQY